MKKKKKKASGKDFLFRCLLFGSSLERDMKLPVLWNLLLQTPTSEVLDSHRQVIHLFAVLLRK